MSQRRRNVRTQLTDELEAERQAEEEAARNQTNRPARPQEAATNTPPVHREESQPSNQKGETREEEDDEELEDSLFEETYKRSTFYIRRAYEPRLKRLVRKFRKRPGNPGKTKYELFEEALEYLFEKYEIK